MASTGFDVFDETVQKTNLLLKAIETEFDWEKRRHQSYAALRAVLHVLRDRLTVEEAAQFAAQLPLLVKGIFYDGWDPSDVPKKINREVFVEEVRRRFPYAMDRRIEDLITTVLKALRSYVSEGELEDVYSMLPKDLSRMLKTG